MLSQRPSAAAATPTRPAVAHKARTGLAVAALAGVALYVTGRAVDGVPVLLLAVVAGALAGAATERWSPTAAKGLAPGWTLASKRVMRIGVVLLGLRLGLGDLAEVSARIAALGRRA